MRASSDDSAVIAAFDFDGTLTRRDSFLPFLWHLAGTVSFGWNAFVLLPTLVKYAVGWLENGNAKERVVRQFFAGRSVEQVRAVADRFAEEVLPELLDPEAMHRFRWHLERGHTTVLVTASPEMYVRPWAEAVGFEAVIATRLETNRGRYTGWFATPNCYGPEKVRRLEREGPDLSGKTVYAYGNSRGDRELLDRADEPFYRSFPIENSGSSRSKEGDALHGSWRRGLIYSLIGAAGLYVGITLWSGVEEILQGLALLSPLTLGALLVLVFSGFLARYVRWDWYLRALGESVPRTRNLEIFLASLALTVTPGKAGESIKAYWLNHSSDVDPSRSLAGVLAERLTDLFSLVLVVCLGLYALPNGRWSVLAIGTLQIAIIASLQRPRWVQRAVLLPLARWSMLRRWIRPLDAMLTDTAELLRPRLLAGGILLGGLPWVGEGVAAFVLFDAVGADAIAFHQAVLIHSAATFFGAITLLPGGLGGYEAAAVSLSLFYGATRSEAVAVTIVMRLMTLWFAALVGAVVALHRR